MIGRLAWLPYEAATGALQWALGRAFDQGFAEAVALHERTFA